MSSSFLSPWRNFSHVFEDYLINNMHTVKSVLGKNAEGVFRRKKEWGSNEWFCWVWACLWMSCLPLQWAWEWHPLFPAVWCSPSQNSGCARARELLECKDDFALLSRLKIASTGAENFAAIPKQESLSNFRYGRCSHSGKSLSQGGLSGTS